MQPVRKPAGMRPNSTETSPCTWTYFIRGKKLTIRHHDEVQTGRRFGLEELKADGTLRK